MQEYMADVRSRLADIDIEYCHMRLSMKATNFSCNKYTLEPVEQIRKLAGVSPLVRADYPTMCSMHPGGTAELFHWRALESQ